MAGAPTLRFYFDYLSPYAYVGWHLVERLSKARGLELVAEPVLLAAILNAHGQKGPAEIPAKRRYVFKDAYRKAHAAGARQPRAAADASVQSAARIGGDDRARASR